MALDIVGDTAGTSTGTLLDSGMTYGLQPFTYIDIGCDMIRNGCRDMIVNHQWIGTMNLSK